MICNKHIKCKTYLPKKRYIAIMYAVILIMHIWDLQNGVYIVRIERIQFKFISYLAFKADVDLTTTNNTSFCA